MLTKIHSGIMFTQDTHSAQTVLPAEVCADTSTDSLLSIHKMASRWNGSRINGYSCKTSKTGQSNPGIMLNLVNQLNMKVIIIKKNNKGFKHLFYCSWITSKLNYFLIKFWGALYLGCFPHSWFQWFILIIGRQSNLEGKDRILMIQVLTFKVREIRQMTN